MFVLSIKIYILKDLPHKDREIQYRNVHKGYKSKVNPSIESQTCIKPQISRKIM